MSIESNKRFKIKYTKQDGYSGVPADELGREQEIAVGPMSGKANAVAWLTKRGHECDEETVDKILAAAKGSDHVLEEDEILGLLSTAST